MDRHVADHVISKWRLLEDTLWGGDVLFKRETRFHVLVFVLEGCESRCFLAARFAGQGAISFPDRAWLPSGQQAE